MSSHGIGPWKASHDDIKRMDLGDFKNGSIKVFCWGLVRQCYVNYTPRSDWHRIKGWDWTWGSTWADAGWQGSTGTKSSMESKLKIIVFSLLRGHSR